MSLLCLGTQPSWPATDAGQDTRFPKFGCKGSVKREKNKEILSFFIYILPKSNRLKVHSLLHAIFINLTDHKGTKTNRRLHFF